MKTIKIFRHEQFGEIRICLADAKELFCLSDVCKALTIGNPSDLKRRLSERGVVTIETPIKNQFGTVVAQKMIYIDEPNLYRCIFQSRKAEAEQFQNWVFEVVLPQIRKTGGYIPINDCEDSHEIMAKALLIAHKTIEQKDALIEMQKPKVRFAEAVSGSDDSILISELAKLITQNGYEIGRTRLFDWMRRNGYLFQHSTEPIQKWVEKGLFETKVTLIHTHHGEQERLTTKVTGKGQEYFINGFVNGRFIYNR